MSFDEAQTSGAAFVRRANSTASAPASSHSASVASTTPAASRASLHSYKIVEHGLRHLRAYRVARDNTARINHGDYSHDGRLLITSSDDDSLVIYDCDKATKIQTVNSKKYGVCLIQFAADNKSVIHGSSKVDNTIRFLSIEKQQYLRYFQGHVKRVRSLSMSPTDALFLSSSLDNTMRLWDTRTHNCQGTLTNSAPAIAAFDRAGMVFAVAFGSRMIKLFDIRHYDKGPFLSINMPPDCNHDASNIQFAPNNKLLVLGTRSDELYVVDTFESRFLHRLRGHKNEGVSEKTQIALLRSHGEHFGNDNFFARYPSNYYISYEIIMRFCEYRYRLQNINLKPTFAPGSRQILCGSSDGYLNVYSVTEGDLVKRYRTTHSAPIENVLFSRRYFMVNTTCTGMQWWMPSLSADSPPGAHKH